MIKNPPAMPDLGSIPGLRRLPATWHDKPLQYSCLENPMDRGAWQATVLGVAKSQTQLSTYIHIYIYMHTWPPLQHASMTVALDANNQTLHSTEFLRTFWKRVICLVIPTDTIKNSERAQLKNHIQSAINYRGTPCLSGRSFVATLQQIDKDRSDRQRIGKLEQEKRAPPLESDNQWRQHHITPSFAAVEPDLPTSPDLP